MAAQYVAPLPADIAHLMPLANYIRNQWTPAVAAIGGAAYTVANVQDTVEEAYQIFVQNGTAPHPSRDRWWTDLDIQFHFPVAKNVFLGYLYQMALVENGKPGWRFGSQPGPTYQQAYDPARARSPTGLIVPDPALPAVFPPSQMTWSTQPQLMYRHALREIFSLPFTPNNVVIPDMKTMYLFLAHLKSLNALIDHTFEIPLNLPPHNDYRNIITHISIEDPFSTWSGYALTALEYSYCIRTLYLTACRRCREHRTHRRADVSKRVSKAKSMWKSLNKRARTHATAAQPARDYANRVVFLAGRYCEACADMSSKLGGGTPRMHRGYYGGTAKQALWAIGRSLVGRPQDKWRVV